LSIVVGFSIIATLAGTSYYGAGAGAVSQTRLPKTQHTTLRESPVSRLDRVGKEKNKAGSSGKLTGTVAGDMQVDEREDGEGYLKLRNIAHEEEEEEEAKAEAEAKKKEEQQKKKEKQDKKDEGQMDKAPGNMKDSAKDRTGKNKNVEGGEEKGEGEKTAGMEDAVKKHNEEEGK
jgi:sRNA-binding protein